MASITEQALRSVVGMVGVITAVLAGSTAGLAAILISDHSLAAALIAGTATTPLAEFGNEGES